MSLATNNAPDPARPNRLFRLAPEQRVNPRVALEVGGRFMLEDRTEHAGTTVNGSIRSLYVRTDATGRAGERVVGYFDIIGRVEGVIERITEDGFILEMQTTARRRDKLASQLIWLANRDVLNLPEDRRHDRVVPKDPRIIVKILGGAADAEYAGHVIDVSLSGAAVSAVGPFQKGQDIMLGTTPARVVRAFDGGIAVEFRASIPESMLNADLKL